MLYTCSCRPWWTWRLCLLDDLHGFSFLAFVFSFPAVEICIAILLCVLSFDSFDDNKLPLLQKAAQQPEVLVPIRLDLEIENHKLRDTFLWNKNGKPYAR